MDPEEDDSADATDSTDLDCLLFRFLERFLGI